MRTSIPVPASFVKVLLFLFGTLFFLFGVYDLRDDYYFTRRATAKAMGIVAGETVRTYTSTLKGRDRYNYDTLIEFTTQEDERVRFYDHQWEYNPFFVVGQKVPVLYDPRNPQDAKLEGTKKSSRTGALIALFIGFIVWLRLGVRLWRAWRKRQDIKWLTTKGEELQTDFVGVIPSRGGLWITSQWLDPSTGITHKFVSQAIDIGLPSLGSLFSASILSRRSATTPPAVNAEDLCSPLLPYLPPSGKISVHTDPHNRKHYYMDVSFLKF